MQLSWEDTTLLLKKWKESRGLVHCSLTTPEGATVGGWVQIKSVEPSQVALQGRSTAASFNPRAASAFDYSEPSELSLEEKLESEGKWEALLSVRLPSGSLLLLGLSLGKIAG